MLIAIILVMHEHIVVVFFAVEKPLESMATSKKAGSSSESSGSSTDSEAEGTGDLLQS